MRRWVSLGDYGTRPSTRRSGPKRRYRGPVVAATWPMPVEGDKSASPRFPSDRPGRRRGAVWFHPTLTHQQDILEILEAALASRAVVRYACAAFWRYRDLQNYQRSHTILEQSAFVSPSALTGHRFWTYDAPGTTGYANPVGKEVSTDTMLSLWAQAGAKGRKQNLLEHLRGLADGLGLSVLTYATVPPWLNAFDTPKKLNASRRQAVFDACSLCDNFGRAGVSWFVADLEAPNP
jgi:hypothetical protein